MVCSPFRLPFRRPIRLYQADTVMQAWVTAEALAAVTAAEATAVRGGARRLPSHALTPPCSCTGSIQGLAV